jgi:hypothetical protein
VKGAISISMACAVEEVHAGNGGANALTVHDCREWGGLAWPGTEGRQEVKLRAQMQRRLRRVDVLASGVGRQRTAREEDEGISKQAGMTSGWNVLMGHEEGQGRPAKNLSLVVCPTRLFTTIHSTVATSRSTRSPRLQQRSATSAVEITPI